MTKFFTLDLPFDRWWSNSTEDVPFEHIEEIREGLNLQWFEIEAPQFNEISPQHLVFYTTSFWINQNQIIKKDDGSDVYYYIYESCNNVMNTNGETVFEVNYVLDEWMSHELYRIRNNMYNKTETWFLNKHHDRFIKKGQIGSWNRKDDSTKWTIDYKNQMYLRAPNTSIHWQTERINQKVSEVEEDITNQPCLFFLSANIEQCAHCDVGHPAGDNQNQSYHKMNQEIVKQIDVPTGEYAGKACMAKRFYRYLPGCKASGQDHADYSDNASPDGYSWGCQQGRIAWQMGAPGTNTFDYAIIPQNHQGYWQQNTIWGPNYTPTWKEVDDFFNLERNSDGSANQVIKRYRYQVYKIQAVAGRAYDDGSNREIKFDYFTNEGELSSLDIDTGTDTFLIVPIVGESGNLRSVPVDYWRVSLWGTTKGKIVSTTIDLETQSTFEQIVQNTFKVSGTTMTTYTDVAPSELVQMLSGWNNTKAGTNFYNRGFDSSVSSIGLYGMHLMPFGIPTTGFMSGRGNVDYFLKTKFLCNDYCPYFIGSILEAETVFTNLQEKGIKFFSDIKKMLDDANETSRSPRVVKENEPLLYAPLFWNLRHNMSNDGKGTLTADMIDWERLYGNEDLTSGHVNVVATDASINPTFNRSYIWDIETCLNKNFEISLAREELIYFDRKQLIDDAPSTFSDPESNTNYEGGGGTASAGGMIQDAANSAYKSGTSLHDASETSAWVQKNQSALGKSYGKASFLANQKLQNAKVGMVFGAAQFVGKLAMSIPKIFEQRTGYVEQQRSYDIPQFGCDILVALSNSLTELSSTSSINFFDNSVFTTTYLIDYFADALFSYHAAYGYYFNTNETFNEILNRNCFNYFLVDNGWNVPKIIKDSLDGYSSLSAYYRTRETSQEYIDRLGLGFRIHTTKYNNYQPWDFDEENNGEIWLAIRFIGIETPWIANPGNIQTRQYRIFAYNPLYPAIEVPINDYTINWKGQDESFNIIAEGNLITITWDNTNIPEDATNGSIEVLITNANPDFPFGHCFIKIGELNIIYIYSNYLLDGDYSTWNFYIKNSDYTLDGDYSDWNIYNITYGN